MLQVTGLVSCQSSQEQYSIVTTHNFASSLRGVESAHKLAPFFSGRVLYLPKRVRGVLEHDGSGLHTRENPGGAAEAGDP